MIFDSDADDATLQMLSRFVALIDLSYSICCFFGFRSNDDEAVETIFTLIIGVRPNPFHNKYNKQTVKK